MGQIYLLFHFVFACLVFSHQAVATATLAVRSQSELDKNISRLHQFRKIQFAAGSFKFKKTLLINSQQTLEGQGSQNTSLIFPFSDKPGISIAGQIEQKIGQVKAPSGQPQNQLIRQREGFNTFSEVGEVLGKQGRYQGPVLIRSLKGLDFNDIIFVKKQRQFKKRLLFEITQGEIFALQPAQDVKVQNLAIVGGGTGISIAHAQNVEIAGVKVQGANQGVEVFESYAVKVVGSEIEDSQKRGVSVVASTNIDIKNNKLNNSQMTGLYVEKGSRIIDVSENSIDGSGLTGSGDGMTFNDVDHLRVIKNKVLRAGCYGVWAENQVKNFVFSENIVMGGVTSGVHFNGSPDSYGSVRQVVATNNIITNNSAHPFLLSPARDTIIKNNIVEAAKGRDGIFRYRGKHTYGDVNRNSIIGENLILRSDQGQLKPGQNGTAENDIVVLPRSDKEPMFLDEYLALVKSKLNFAKKIKVKDVGFEGQGALLVKKSGQVVSVNEVPTKKIRLTPSKPGRLKVKLATLALDSISPFLNQSKHATLQFEHGKTCDFRLDLYSGNQRLYVVPCQDKQTSTTRILFDLKDKFVGQDTLDIFMVKNKDSSDIKTLRLLPGRWPAPILTQ